MRKIIVSVPDQLYRRARMRAAARDTSVSALVRDFRASRADRLSHEQALAVRRHLAHGRAYEGVKVVNPFRR